MSSNWEIVKKIALNILENEPCFTKRQVELIFEVECPNRDVNNVYPELQQLSVNSQSRLSYLPIYGKVKSDGVLHHESKNNSLSEYPRISNPSNDKDILFYTENGVYELYNPLRHGIYVIELDDNCVNRITHIQPGESELHDRVKASAKLTREQRLARLSKANKIPEKIEVKVTSYKRNPDVIAERLLISQGCCEDCKNPAPFKRKLDASPFLEVHHKQPLSNGGEDTVENTIALCPNCHRKRHYG